MAGILPLAELAGVIVDRLHSGGAICVLVSCRVPINAQTTYDLES